MNGGNGSFAKGEGKGRLGCMHGVGAKARGAKDELGLLREQSARVRRWVTRREGRQKRLAVDLLGLAQTMLR